MKGKEIRDRKKNKPTKSDSNHTQIAYEGIKKFFLPMKFLPAEKYPIASWQNILA